MVRPFLIGCLDLIQIAQVTTVSLHQLLVCFILLETTPGTLVKQSEGSTQICLPPTAQCGKGMGLQISSVSLHNPTLMLTII